MRGGIPIAVRLFALAAMAFGQERSGKGGISPEMASAQKAVAHRAFYYTAGTEQRKRRKMARRKSHNGRRA
jgi:hypothetical protein